MNCYHDNRPCNCKEADECGRDPFRGPVDDDEIEQIIEAGASLNDAD